MTNTASNGSSAIIDSAGFAATVIGWLIALFENIRALDVGVEAVDTVAVQCVVGRSFKKHFFFNGPISSNARYRGMQWGFGALREIMASAQYSYCTPHTYKLLVAEYNDSA